MADVEKVQTKEQRAGRPCESLAIDSQVHYCEEAGTVSWKANPAILCPLCDGECSGHLACPDHAAVLAERGHLVEG